MYLCNVWAILLHVFQSSSWLLAAGFGRHAQDGGRLSQLESHWFCRRPAGGHVGDGAPAPARLLGHRAQRAAAQDAAVQRHDLPRQLGFRAARWDSIVHPASLQGPERAASLSWGDGDGSNVLAVCCGKLPAVEQQSVLSALRPFDPPSLNPRLMRVDLSIHTQGNSTLQLRSCCVPNHSAQTVWGDDPHSSAQTHRCAPVQISRSGHSGGSCWRRWRSRPRRRSPWWAPGGASAAPVPTRSSPTAAARSRPTTRTASCSGRCAVPGILGLAQSPRSCSLADLSCDFQRLAAYRLDCRYTCRFWLPRSTGMLNSSWTASHIEQSSHVVGVLTAPRGGRLSYKYGNNCA
jgi:hypothetical protein